MATPASFDNATVRNLTVQNVGDTMLLDMRATSEITDAVFDHVTFSLSGDFTGAVPIGNGQISGSIALHDGGDADQAGLTFQHVTMASNNHLAGTTAFVYTTMESVGGGQDGARRRDAHRHGLRDVDGPRRPVEHDERRGPGFRRHRQLAHQHRREFYVSGFNGVTHPGQHLRRPGRRPQRRQARDRDRQYLPEHRGTITANGTQHRGLVIEDAWGTNGVSDVTVTGNTFHNIDAVDGAIAFQRFTDGSPADTATIARLNDVDIHGNTFTDLGTGVDPVYITGSDLFRCRGGAAQQLSRRQPPRRHVGRRHSCRCQRRRQRDLRLCRQRHHHRRRGRRRPDGGAGTDTAVFSGFHTAYNVSGLTGPGRRGVGRRRRARRRGHGFPELEVLEFADGFHVLAGMSIQAAINAASDGDTIFIAAGTYREQVSVVGKDLTITGAGEGQTIIESPDAAALVESVHESDSGLPYRYWVVTIKNGADVTLTGVTVDGRDRQHLLRARRV